MKPKQAKGYETKKNVSKLMVLLALALSISNCQIQEEASTQENQESAFIYKKQISSYLKNLKQTSTKEDGVKVNELATALEINRLKIYDLYSTEKLIVADVKYLKGFHSSNKIKLIIFLYAGKITRAEIVTFHNKIPFDNYDTVIRLILDMKKNKDNYTGTVTFYNLIQNILLSDEFENGKLTVNGIARRKMKNRTTEKATGCIDWYWITTYFDGRQTEEHLRKSCHEKF